MYHSGGSPTQGENPILKLISTNRRQLVIGADIIFFKGPTSKLDFIVALEAKCSVSWKLFSQKDHFLQKKKKKRARIFFFFFSPWKVVLYTVYRGLDPF